MTGKDPGARTNTAAVRVRAAGDVDEGSLTYVREKVDAVLGRPGVPVVSGEVKISKAAAHRAEQPWSALAQLVVGNHLVVVQAQEATARELADRLQDRMHAQVNRTLHRGEEARRSATPPPWRGGRAVGERP
ncbi:hypothetical protein LK07_30355 [Streptomyces pluripotens]|uniref:Uncharacterized protein n=1 Tax=Streptomyces pluripotens TaxID=1355015 RepID=A0A221P763_9ACTN|nr:MULTISPECIES: hypothetical protein [Streptomyces]ARP73377.1 hypothetical protein LK06_029185 [Streptomyces pluripotens]ASN27625.1 hypothetical protein LK07_30355 [Streptomyces pluripotens]MCH0560305.1 hypothetical protein [Streptomyces sp. MUM 16J]